MNHIPFDTIMTPGEVAAYKFSRDHDWGAGAVVVMTGDGLRIDVDDNYTLDGVAHSDRIRLPLTLKSLQDFGGY